MASMTPSYDSLDNARLEEVLRERAFGADADLRVGRVEDGRWRAAYRFYGPAVAATGEFTEGERARGATKRKALIGLAQIDDIGTVS